MSRNAQRFPRRTQRRFADIMIGNRQPLREFSNSLCGERLDSRVGELRIVIRHAVENTGKTEQERRSASRTLLGAIADRAAVRTQVGLRQRDV